MRTDLDRREIKPGDQVIESLLHLRTELINSGNSRNIEVASKLDYCLYHRYPPNDSVKTRGTD